MTNSAALHSGTIDWANVTLPDAWPDALNLKNPRDLWQFMQCALGKKREPVQLPEGLIGSENIPKYILQEFHGLPNGNYSRRFTRGYITGFNRSMLGEINKSHTAMAQQLSRYSEIRQGCVLDVGCGGGGLASKLQQAGIKQIYGLDPSPYLLQHAARDWPNIQFVQGVAEKTYFSDAQFNAITACFLLHEIPPRYITQCLQEWSRILKPNGLVSICEPSPEQWKKSLLQLTREYGWRGFYFGCLAAHVYEPFLAAWHQQDITSQLKTLGFEVIEHTVGMPMRYILARKI
jgi:ubiquinone/menaquinone biosynthesis C-methylase UbiE